mgnify:CR=1 FL=1
MSSLRKLLGPTAIATVPRTRLPVRRRARARRGDRRGAPARHATTNPNNLPQLRTRFIGREKALDDCAEPAARHAAPHALRHRRLRQDAAGAGTGAAAAGCVPGRRVVRRPGAVAGRGACPATVAATLGIKDAVMAPLERLTDHLKSRQTLVGAGQLRARDRCRRRIDRRCFSETAAR